MTLSLIPNNEHTLLEVFGDGSARGFGAILVGDDGAPVAGALLRESGHQIVLEEIRGEPAAIGLIVGVAWGVGCVLGRPVVVMSPEDWVRDALIERGFDRVARDVYVAVFSKGKGPVAEAQTLGKEKNPAPKTVPRKRPSAKRQRAV